MDPIARNLNWGNILQDENCVFKAVTAALLEVKKKKMDRVIIGLRQKIKCASGFDLAARLCAGSSFRWTEKDTKANVIRKMELDAGYGSTDANRKFMYGSRRGV